MILVADRENVSGLRNKIEKAFQILDRYLYWFKKCSMQKIHFLSASSSCSRFYILDFQNS